MSATERVRDAAALIMRPADVDALLDQLVAEVARRVRRETLTEAAQRIRNSDELRDLTDGHMADCNAAADLIDPEAQR